MTGIVLVATPAAAVRADRAADTTADTVWMPVDRSGVAFADCATRPGDALCGVGRAADILFVDISDPHRPIATRSFSLLAAEDGAMLTAYNAAGRTIGSVRGGGDGERVTLVGAIARIAVRPAAAIRPAPARTAAGPGAGAGAAAMSHVPEPATWTMLMIGFAMIAAGVRHWMRRSQARFDDHIRRIAAGEAL